ncbi:hypothetical protein Droror1_Dr00018755 [Drosera rotundifolia]
MATNPSNPDQQPPPPTPPATDNQAQDPKKWGTHVMGPPSNPTAHPENQQAATWDASEHQRMFFHDQQQQPPPYVVHSPAQRPASSPLKPVVDSFNNWSRKAETIARNIWHNLRTGPSVPEAAWWKINLTARVVSEGGFEGMFKQIFEVQGNEKLKKTFACYLSTSTGPVAGTLYLSDARVGFCSDRPLSFHAPSGQEAWSYYKLNIPLACLSSVNPVTLRENPTEKYIHLITVDNHEFWLMGFVNFEKATHHLLSTLSESRAAELGERPPAS